MAKTKMLVIRISEEQDQQLQERCRTAGFAKKSEFVRMIIFQGEKNGS